MFVVYLALYFLFPPFFFSFHFLWVVSVTTKLVEIYQ